MNEEVQKQTFNIDIFELMHIDILNDALEKFLADINVEGLPSDISYKFKDISEDGTLLVEAEFLLVGLDE